VASVTCLSSDTLPRLPLAAMTLKEERSDQFQEKYRSSSRPTRATAAARLDPTRTTMMMATMRIRIIHQHMNNKAWSRFSDRRNASSPSPTPWRPPCRSSTCLHASTPPTRDILSDPASRPVAQIRQVPTSVSTPERKKKRQWIVVKLSICVLRGSDTTSLLPVLNHCCYATLQDRWWARWMGG
jgi:hypothetical protein